MRRIYSIPSKEEIERLQKLVPDHIPRSNNPAAVVFEGFLGPKECDEIVRVGLVEEPYHFRTCDSDGTREFPRPLDSVLSPLFDIGVAANTTTWRFDLEFNTTMAWMQSYSNGSFYHKHMDADYGQSRKLTAVLMLSDPSDYTAGELRVEVMDEQWVTIPKTQGTVVVFPAWVKHEVTPVATGLRMSINMGFFGPSFR